MPPRTYLPNAVFLPDHFKDNGYFTASIGKVFHETPSMKRGSCERPLCMEPQEKGGVKGASETPAVASSRDGDTQFRGSNSMFRTKTPRMARPPAVSRVKPRRGPSQTGAPFFLAAGFYKPHLMWEAPKKYFDLYKPEDIRLPDELQGHLAQVPETGSRPVRRNPAQRISTGVRPYALLRLYFVRGCAGGRALDQMDKLKLWTAR